MPAIRRAGWIKRLKRHSRPTRRNWSIRRFCRKPTSSLDTAESSIAAGDEKGAIKLMSKIPPVARLDPKFAAREDAVQKKLEATASSMLSDVQTQIDQGKYIDCRGSAQGIVHRLAGLPEAARAKLMLASLMAKPDVKSAIENAEKEPKASASAGGRAETADPEEGRAGLRPFSDVVKFFPGTDSAGSCTGADRHLQEEHRLHEADDRARRLQRKPWPSFTWATAIRLPGTPEMARKKYQSVIDDFPGTSYAVLRRNRWTTCQVSDSSNFSIGC